MKTKTKFVKYYEIFLEEQGREFWFKLDIHESFIEGQKVNLSFYDFSKN